MVSLSKQGAQAKSQAATYLHMQLCKQREIHAPMPMPSNAILKAAKMLTPTHLLRITLSHGVFWVTVQVESKTLAPWHPQKP